MCASRPSLVLMGLLARAMVPSIVAGSIGARGWSPAEKPEDQLRGEKPDLESQPGVVVHPDTAPNDPGSVSSQNPGLGLSSPAMPKE